MGLLTLVKLGAAAKGGYELAQALGLKDKLVERTVARKPTTTTERLKAVATELAAIADDMERGKK